MNLCLLALAVVLGDPTFVEWADLTDQVEISPDAPDLPAMGPTHIEIDGDGRVFVYASVEQEMLALDRRGRVSARWRSDAPSPKHPTGPRAFKRSRFGGEIVDETTGRRWTVTTEAELGALHVVAVDRASRVHVVAEELLSRSPVRVRRSVHVLSPRGGEVSRFELPGPSPVRIDREWAVAPDGAFYLLQATPTQVRVLTWGAP